MHTETITNAATSPDIQAQLDQMEPGYKVGRYRKPIDWSSMSLFDRIHKSLHLSGFYRDNNRYECIKAKDRDVARDGFDYDVIRVHVSVKGWRVGILEICTMLVSKDYEVVCMRLKEWKLERGGFMYFQQAINPRHIRAYVDMFMNLDGEGYFQLVRQALASARFFDSTYGRNPHVAAGSTSLSARSLTTAVHIKDEKGCSIPCKLSVALKGDDVSFMLSDGDGFVLNSHTLSYSYCPYWAMPSIIRRFVSHPNVLRNLNSR